MNYLTKTDQQILSMSMPGFADKAVDPGNEEAAVEPEGVQNVEPKVIGRESCSSPNEEECCSEDESRELDKEDLDLMTRLSQSNAKLKEEVDRKNQMIEELLHLSKHATKELRCAKRHKTEEAKEQELQIANLEKRLNKLDVEKDDLNKKVIQLQKNRLELLEKNLEEKEEKLKLSDLRNSVSQGIIVSLQADLKKSEEDNELKMSAMHSQLDQAMTTIEHLKVRLAESEKKTGLQKGDTPSRARNENRKLSAKVDELKRKLDDVTGEKRELAAKLKAAEAKLADFCDDENRRKKDKSEAGQNAKWNRLEKTNDLKSIGQSIGLDFSSGNGLDKNTAKPPSARGVTSNALELELRSLLEAEKVARLKLLLVADLHDDDARKEKLNRIRELGGASYCAEE